MPENLKFGDIVTLNDGTIALYMGESSGDEVVVVPLTDEEVAHCKAAGFIWSQN